jgi:NADH-quinone oxidoreductase subunit I
MGHTIKPSYTFTTYWITILAGISSLLKGLKLSLSHILKSTKRKKTIAITDPDYFKQTTGRITLLYPYEKPFLTDNGRHQLHNEIEDCIVCDKCVKVCPVNCIEIESIKAPYEIGKTSDGTTKRLYAAQFDIDMGKCCFCGLCTTVCPTECLTMTNTYSYGTSDINKLTFHFSALTDEEIEEKKKEISNYQKDKENNKSSNSLPHSSIIKPKLDSNSTENKKDDN